MENRVRIKRIGVLSLAIVTGAIYAIVGLIVGILFSLFSIALSSAFGAEPGFFGAIFGVGAVIFLPILYGILGFIAGVVTAFVYNLVAGWFGGVELVME